MNWIRLEDKLPEFEKVVLLYEKKEDKNYVSTGYLSKIDRLGSHFITNKPNNFSSIFGGAFNQDDINPTHWAEITIPE